MAGKNLALVAALGNSSYDLYMPNIDFPCLLLTFLNADSEKRDRFTAPASRPAMGREHLPWAEVVKMDLSPDGTNVVSRASRPTPKARAGLVGRRSGLDFVRGGAAPNPFPVQPAIARAERFV